MVAPYPDAAGIVADPQSEQIMEAIIEIIHSIRNIRLEFKVESSKWIPAQIDAGDLLSAISSHTQTIQTLAKVNPLTFGDTSGESPVWGDAMTLGLILTQGIKVSIPLIGMVNLEAEKKRLHQEIDQSQAQVARLEARLTDTAFLTKAPPAIVAKEKNNLALRKDKLERLKQQLNRFN
ncbi:Valine--tRNA ligase [subsurface metagenome]